MKTNQIEWASRHVWFETALLDGSVLVRCDMQAGHLLRFDNFTELKTWAGY